jgi:hypothetical protein
MPKRRIAALLAAFAVVSLVAQEVTDTSALTMLNVGSYSKLFLNGNGLLSRTYTRAVSQIEEYNRVASLNGNDATIDTPLEIALLSTCTGVVDVRPVEADAILPANNPRLSGLKLGSAVLKENCPS